MRTVLAILLICAPAGFAAELRDVKITESAFAKSSGRRGGHPRRTFSGGPGSSDPTHLVIHNYTLYQMIMEVFAADSLDIAYQHLSTSQRHALFGPELDIEAIVPEGVSVESFHGMLRSLLARRFGLVVHRAMLDVPVFRLRVSPAGVKIKQHPPDAPSRATGDVIWDADRKMLRVNQWTSDDAGDTVVRRFQAVNLSMADLAEGIARAAEMPVIDQTHLSGKYDFLLTCGPMPFEDVFTGCKAILPGAIGQQLGLELEAGTAPRKMLQIDDCRPPVYTAKGR